MSTKLPTGGGWASFTPTHNEIKVFLQNAGTKKVDALRYLVGVGVDKLWETLPSVVNIVYYNGSPGGSWWKREINPAKQLGDAITKTITSQGVEDQPYEMAHRLIKTKVDYAQCLRKYHLVEAPLFGPPRPATLLPSHKLSTVLFSGLCLQQFKEQLALCEDHERGHCTTCSAPYTVLEQAPKFWTSKVEECGECLGHNLMYVEAKHRAKDLVIKTGGKRSVYRKTVWSVGDWPSVPVGPPHQAEPSGIEVPAFATVTAAGGSVLSYANPFLINTPYLSPNEPEEPGWEEPPQDWDSDEPSNLL